MKNKYIHHLVVFIAGITFALGLGIGGMTNPNKVIGFLNITGKWDPTLLVVLGSGTGLTFILFQFVLKRPNPILVESFSLPTRRDIDFKLVAGATLFGAGWALGGFCPGPAIVSSATMLPGALAFLGAMAIGSFAYAFLNK